MAATGCAGRKLAVSVAFTDHPEDTGPMPASPHDLFAFLDRLGVRHATVTHPPLFTVADSQSLRGQIAGGHTKNLFLKDKAGALVLVVAHSCSKNGVASLAYG
jgi:Ala-tRNA(Pro) deacylase